MSTSPSDEFQRRFDEAGKATEMAWPPPDAQDLLARWESQDRPEIPLAPGKSISNLERWFYPTHSQGANGTVGELNQVRRLLGAESWQESLF